MPRGDRTGPRGDGPRTGRAAGYCAGFNAPGYASPGRGGRRCGGGRGQGFRGRNSWVYGPAQPEPKAARTPSDEKAELEDTVRSLEAELSELRSRLQSLSE